MSATRLVTFLALTAIAPALPALAQLAPLGDELPISSVTDKNRQLWPAAGLSAGATRLAWQDDSLGIVSSVVTAPEAGAGTPTVLAANDPLPETKPYRVNLREQHQPALATQSDGSFLLVWTEATVFRNVAAAYIDEKTPISSRVVGRQFAANGQPVGAVFEIANGKGTAARPVATAAEGDIWVAWEESDGAAAGVHFRSVDAKGHLGKDVLAGAGGRNAALAATGKAILVAWDHDDNQEKTTAFVRLFKMSGSPVGAAVALGSGATSSGFPAAAAAKNGEFLIAWQGGPDATFADSHVYGQLLQQKGSSISLAGTPRMLSTGDGTRHLLPAVAALEDGRWAAAWVAWKGFVPLAVDVATLDAAGAVVGQPLRLNDRRPLELGTIAMAAQASQVWTSWVSAGPDGHSRIRARAASTAPNSSPAPSPPPAAH
ncbi:MAG TPA: hypothetical protein VGS57_00425 [Thermoanaerobaculia bacterium]|jgi:hypothetical protein|nr:hypothetical protein [Thermoanaerobaculia bacterium]